MTALAAPRGAVTLMVAGRPVRVTGGPFDALPAGARGLCLDARAARAAEAAWRLDVPDFGAPEAAALRATLAAMLAAMRAAPGDDYHVGCRAGLGRTGMALACLGAMTGVADPLRWVRATYHPAAVETPAQEALVARFAESVA
jgi:protein-tyrosine phosphatase